MERLKYEGIIMRKRKGKENDQVLTVLSKERGKQFILAKGANTITSRRVGILDTLNIIRYETHERAGYAYLRTVDLVSRLQIIKDVPVRRTNLLLAMDVLNRLLPLEEPEERLYAVLQQYIAALAKSEAPQQDTRLFLAEALTLLGYHHEIVTLSDAVTLVEEITQRSMHRAWKFLMAYHV